MATERALAKLGFLELSFHYLLVLVIIETAQTRRTSLLDWPAFQKCDQKVCFEAEATNWDEKEAEDVPERVKKSAKIAQIVQGAVS